MKRALLVLCLAACSSESVSGDPVVPGEPRLSSIQSTIFTPSCASFYACHDRSSPAGLLDLTEGSSHGQLVGRASEMMPTTMLVVPGDPDGSFLVWKLRGDLGEEMGEPMPFGNPPLPEEEISLIEEWIARGAAND